MKAKTAFVGFAIAALCCIAQAQGPTSDSVRESGTVRVVTLPGGATMEMIWCAPGTFDMGSPVGEDGRFENEVPHQVTLTRGFWLGKHEVTQRQWESVMHSNNSRFRNPDSPVENISWHDCATFLKRVNVALGGAARFPTEAEWEYACRAGSDAPVAGSGVLADMACLMRSYWSRFVDAAISSNRQKCTSRPSRWRVWLVSGVM